MTDEKTTTTTEETPDKRTTTVETDRWVPVSPLDPSEVTTVTMETTTTVEPKE